MTKRRTVIAHMNVAVASMEKAITIAARCPEIKTGELTLLRDQFLAVLRAKDRLGKRDR